MCLAAAYRIARLGRPSAYRRGLCSPGCRGVGRKNFSKTFWLERTSLCPAEARGKAPFGPIQCLHEPGVRWRYTPKLRDKTFKQLLVYCLHFIIVFDVSLVSKKKQGLNAKSNNSEARKESTTAHLNLPQCAGRDE